MRILGQIKTAGLIQSAPFDFIGLSTEQYAPDNLDNASCHGTNGSPANTGNEHSD